MKAKCEGVQQNVEKTETGYCIVDDNGKKLFVSYDELYGKDPDLNQKRPKWNLMSRLPESVKALLFLKNEEDRIKYLKNQPQHSINALAGWFTFVILKGNILEKCVKMGISVPETLLKFFSRVEEEIKRTGKLTLESVNKVVETLIDGTIAIAVITFGVIILMNPILLPVILALLTVGDFRGIFKKKKNDQ